MFNAGASESYRAEILEEEDVKRGLQDARYHYVECAFLAFARECVQRLAETTAKTGKVSSCIEWEG